jgi:hypothetical protein
MRKIFPAPFQFKDWALALLAVGVAFISVMVSGLAGYGGGVALFLFDIFGALFFVAVIGASRVFYTSLFSGTIVVVFVTWSSYDDMFVDHNFDWRESLFKFAAIFLVYMPLPVSFAWLVNWLLKRRLRGSRGSTQS